MTKVWRRRTCTAILGVWLGIAPPVVGWQQHQREPLTQVEIDELRDAAQEPTARIKLFIEFARTRLLSLEQLRADPKVTDKPQQTHDKLQEFLDIYDELNDNLDTFVQRKADLRKPLKAVIEADNEFQAKLRALKSSAETGPESSVYQFVLDNAVDEVDGSVRDHGQLLAEEEAARRKKK